MDDIEVTFPGGKRVDAHIGAHVVCTDQPVEAGGEGRAVAPFDLFLASIATCAGIYVLGFCQARGLSIEGIRMRQRVELDAETHLPSCIRLDLYLPPSFPGKHRAAVMHAAAGYSVGPEAPLDEVVAEMGSRKYGSVVIMQNEKVVGTSRRSTSAGRSPSSCTRGSPSEARTPPDVRSLCVLPRVLHRNVLTERTAMHRIVVGLDRSSSSRVVHRAALGIARATHGKLLMFRAAEGLAKSTHRIRRSSRRPKPSSKSSRARTRPSSLSGRTQ